MSRLVFGAAFVLGLMMSSDSRGDVVVVFEIDPTQSHLTVGGVIDVGPAPGFLGGQFPVAEQKEGALTTSFAGTITARLDDLANPTSIEFISAELTGLINPNGPFQPNDAGNALIPAGDANFGMRSDLGDGKLRNIAFNMSSGGNAISISNGLFGQGDQVWQYTSGDIDLFSPSLSTGNSQAFPVAPEDGFAVANNTGSDGSLANIAGVNVLTLPVDVDLEWFIPGTPTVGGNFRYTGTLVTAVPEPTTWGTLGVLSLGLVWLVRRRSVRGLPAPSC